MLKELEATQWKTVELVVGSATEDVVSALKNSGFAARKGNHTKLVLVAIPSAQSNELESWLETTPFDVELPMRETNSGCLLN